MIPTLEEHRLTALVGELRTPPVGAPGRRYTGDGRRFVGLCIAFPVEVYLRSSPRTVAVNRVSGVGIDWAMDETCPSELGLQPRVKL